MSDKFNSPYSHPHCP